MMKEVATFKRGVDPKTSLGIGKFCHLKEWWENMTGSDYVLHETRMEYLVKKLVDILGEEQDVWTRADVTSHITHPGVKTFRSYLCIDRLDISISLCDEGNIYIWSDTFFIEPSKVGNMGINPGDVIKEILKLYEVVKEKQKQKDIDEAIVEYKKEVWEAIYRLDSLRVVPFEMIKIIQLAADERIKKNRKSFWYRED